MGEDRCICCGDIIPEGRQICEPCEWEWKENEAQAEYIRQYNLRTANRQSILQRIKCLIYARKGG